MYNKRSMQWINHHRFPILLTLLGLILLLTNYVPGTFLSGWDNLQTDLNPWLGVKRAIFAVWEEYQSFGLVSGMAHAADLIRALGIWILSWVLPASTIRYVFHTLMLIIGGMGMYRLLTTIGFHHEKRVYAFLGSVFYMVNLATLQMFFLPYEPFSIFFAALPWQMWIFIEYIHQRKSLIPLFIINILATPYSYVQTLFIVEFLIYGIITLTTFFEEKQFASIKRSIIAGIIIILINSFWLLPQLYFLKTSSYIVTEAKTNILSTEDVIYQNREKSTVKNFIKMEGYYYDLYDTHQLPLFLNWKIHLSKPGFAVLPYLFAGIILLGLWSRRKHHGIFVGMYLLCALGLLSTVPPFSFINDVMRQNPVINQIFRSPFTKFAIPYALVASYLFTSGLVFLHHLLPRLQRIPPMVVITSILLILYGVPAIGGNFYSKQMKVKIPQDYMDTMEYFKGIDKNKRIALLPDYTFWGWFVTRWGYNGSGFLWYGIEQPIVSRTFDVWSEKSESYFWEMKAASEAEDVGAFEKIVEKYDIDYLILDTSLLPVSATLKGMQYERINAILGQSRKITLVMKRENLSVYRVEHSKKVQSFLTMATALPNIGPEVKLTNADTAYYEYGDYQTDSRTPYEAYYPFLDLTTQTPINQKLWNIKETPTHFTIESKLSIDPAEYILSQNFSVDNAVLYRKEELTQFGNVIKTSIKNNVISLTFPKELIYYVPFPDTKIEHCGSWFGTIESSVKTSEMRVRSANQGIACFGFDLPFLEQKYGYLTVVENENIQGRRLFLYILDKTKRQSYIEDRFTENTQYYIISPKYQYGLGYNLSFQNTSYTNVRSENVLKNITLYLFPTEELKYTKLTQKNVSIIPAQPLNTFTGSKRNYFTYQVLKDTTQDSTLILYQAFHPGWNAYAFTGPGNPLQSLIIQTFPFLGEELTDHLMINNWANGWKTAPSDRLIFVLFWPQYLEYFGLFLLIATTGILLWKEKKKALD